MPKRGLLTFQYFARSLLLMSVMFVLTGPASAQKTENACSSDGTIRACIVSSALTLGDPSRRFAHIVVSNTVMLENLTDFPLEVLLMEDFSYMPRNAIALTPRFNPEVSGIASCGPRPGSVPCRNIAKIRPTTLFPKKPVRIQISYTAEVQKDALGLAQITSTAAFSASLFVTERGTTRVVALPIPEFEFGNGLAVR